MGKIINYISGYTTDYPEICKYKNAFENIRNMEVLRKEIFEWLDTLKEQEVDDVITKLKIQIEEINKMNISLAVLPFITFLLGGIGELYKISEGLFMYFLVSVALMSMYLIYSFKRSIKHYKYYIFLQNIIDRYKLND